jgi:hypothetical protein
MSDYLPGVVLEKDRYGCCLFAPAYCVQRSCRRANACLGNKHGPCLADERKEGVSRTRWIECMKHLKAHGKAPEWFHPPFEKEPETEESRAEFRAIMLELAKRLWNAHRQLKAFPETRKNMNEVVLRMLEFVDFTHIRDDHPIPRLEEGSELGCEARTRLPVAPVLSQPRIRAGCD